MENYTEKQIKEIVGTEFLYVFDDRAEIPAVVAAFDVNVGFTCLATSRTDSLGDDHSSGEDENGNNCLIGIDRKVCRGRVDFMRTVSFYARSIKQLGFYVADSSRGFGHFDQHTGSAHCAF